MSRHYGLPIRVERDPHTRLPRSLVWHGTTYRVREVISHWHLMDRWWEATNPYHPDGGVTNRHYYRVVCELRAFGSLAIFELYFDAAQNTWGMDSVLD
jgi:hypothetical protein